MSTPKLLQKGLSLLLKRQTNILSAAFIIMFTVIISQVLGLVRQRLLVAVFGASNTLGVYLASSRLPDLLFQVIIAGALSSAFIPVFSEFVVKKDTKNGHTFASTLLTGAISAFSVVAIILFIFAPFFASLIAPGFNASETMLMANLMRFILIGELLFLVGSFASAILQSYDHFFVPGIAAATYNLGIIVGILTLHQWVGIYAPAYGVLFGSLLFILLQVPTLKKVGFKFSFAFDFGSSAMKHIFKLMWPRTISLGIFQIGSLITLTLISLLEDPGRKFVIFDYAQTLAFAPVGLFGQTIAQAAFPVLSRERGRLEEFRHTFVTSFYQLLYLVMPVSVLFIVLRIPVVRLIYGASQFDWVATVLTGKALALFAISLFAQSLTYLVSRAYYALLDTKTPLIMGAISTAFMLLVSYLAVLWHFDVPGLAFVYSAASVLQLVLLLLFLDRKAGRFISWNFMLCITKIFFASFVMGVALYVPIKLLDQVVFDTTHTINLLLLTGISSVCGLIFYLLLTWLFRVNEAGLFISIIKKMGNWKEILSESNETLPGVSKSS